MEKIKLWCLIWWTRLNLFFLEQEFESILGDVDVKLEFIKKGTNLKAIVITGNGSSDISLSKFALEIKKAVQNDYVARKLNPRPTSEIMYFKSICKVFIKIEDVVGLCSATEEKIKDFQKNCEKINQDLCHIHLLFGNH